MSAKKPKKLLWHIKLIKGDIYHPTDKGAIVEALTAAEAEKRYKDFTLLDNGPEGEFAFYEPTAEIVELINGVGIL